jgi:Ca2+-binding EF-hand superfamily protein
MGGLQPKESFQANGAFNAKEMYNLKQVYFFLCLHTTTLTSCQLDHNQFHALFGSRKQYKGLWRPLFTAIDQKRDNVIDFEEFLTFVTHLKRGDAADRRLLCFRVYDSNHDGYAEKSDIQRIAETRANCRRKTWSTASNNEADWEEECTQFFSLVDEDNDGKFKFEEFDNYCAVYGETQVNQTLELLENMFDGAVEETGIVITATDVKNSKPHIDWQDNKIRMGSLLCCSSQPPIFTKAPTM